MNMLGRGTHNSQRAGLLPQPMETSENDQKDNSLDNATDKENTENGNKQFATKDPGSKYGRKIRDLPWKLAHPEVRSLSGHTVFAKLKSEKEVSSACGVLMSSIY